VADAAKGAGATLTARAGAGLGRTEKIKNQRERILKSILRILIGLVVIFNLLLGAGFLFSPARMAALFFLSPDGVQGLATLRADFSSFFIAAALFAFYGAWKAHAAPLLAPLAMFAIAFIGRCIGLISDGVTPTAFTPMVVEAVMMAILLAGWRSFSRTSPQT